MNTTNSTKRDFQADANLAVAIATGTKTTTPAAARDYRPFCCAQGHCHGTMAQAFDCNSSAKGSGK